MGAVADIGLVFFVSFIPAVFIYFLVRVSEHWRVRR